MEVLNSISSNLTRLREKRGLTISGLAQRCGIAKSTLSSLEAGKGNPTIETLWAIANALDVPFGSLLPSSAQMETKLGDEKTTVRFIDRSQSDNGASIETYSMSIERGHTKESAAHPPGVREKVVVTRGPMLVGDRQSPRLVNTGEVYTFEADVPHVYGALGDAVHAMVFVEYPAARLQGTELLCVLDWPAAEAAWDVARGIVARMRIEVASGVAVRMLRLRGCTESPARALKALRGELLHKPAGRYCWPVLEISDIDEEGPFLALLPQHFTRAFQAGSEELGDMPLAGRALALAGFAESGLSPGGKSAAIANGSSESLTLEALARECDLRQGKLRVPDQLRQMAQHSRGGEEETMSLAHSDVFGWLHPACARQVVAVAQDIAAFLPDASAVPVQSIVVGAGSGAPLLMLRELLPGVQLLAVEPDPAAYARLQFNARGVALYQGGFLELEHPDGQTQLIISIGALRQLNAAFMLQQAIRLLRPGGVLSIADDFLSPFHDIKGRNLALVLHHASPYSRNCILD